MDRLKNRLVWALISVWIVGSITLLGIGGKVFFKQMSVGTYAYNTITELQMQNDVPINGNVYMVYDCIAEYYTESTDKYTGRTTTTSNAFYYIIPFEEDRFMIIKVKANTSLETEIDDQWEKTWDYLDDKIDADALGDGVQISGKLVLNDPEVVSYFNEWRDEVEYPEASVVPYTIDLTRSISTYMIYFWIGLILLISFIVALVFFIYKFLGGKRSSSTSSFGGNSGYGSVSAGISPGSYDPNVNYVAGNSYGSAQSTGNYDPTNIYQSNNTYGSTQNSSYGNSSGFQTQGGSSYNSDSTYSSGNSYGSTQNSGYGNSSGFQTQSGSSYNSGSTYSSGNSYGSTQNSGYGNSSGFQTQGGSSYNSDSTYSSGNSYGSTQNSGYGNSSGFQTQGGSSYNSDSTYSSGNSYGSTQNSGYGNSSGFQTQGGSSYNSDSTYSSSNSYGLTQNSGYGNSSGFQTQGGSSYNSDSTYSSGNSYGSTQNSSYGNSSGFQTQGGSSYNSGSNYSSSNSYGFDNSLTDTDSDNSNY